MKILNSSTVVFFPPTSPISPPTETVIPAGSMLRISAVSSALIT